MEDRGRVVLVARSRSPSGRALPEPGGCIPYTCSCGCACVCVCACCVLRVVQERVGLTWAAYAQVLVAEDTTAPHRPRYSTSLWRRYSYTGNCTRVRGAHYSSFVTRQWCG